MDISSFLKNIEGVPGLPVEFENLQRDLNDAMTVKRAVRVVFVEAAWTFAVGHIHDENSPKDKKKMRKILQDHLAVVQKSDDNDGMETSDFHPVLLGEVRSLLADQ